MAFMFDSWVFSQASDQVKVTEGFQKQIGHHLPDSYLEGSLHSYLVHMGTSP